VNSPEIFVSVCPWSDVIELRLSHDGMWMQEPLFANVREGEKPPVSVNLDMTQAQALMDRLWTAGLRPTEGSGSAGALLATQSHLLDMRTVAFAALGLEE
jgi:hypothetical protein